MDTIEVSKAIESLPLTVLLLLVLIGGYVEWWVYGSLHRKEIKSKDDQITELKKNLIDERAEHERIENELRTEITKWQERVFQWDGLTERRK